MTYEEIKDAARWVAQREDPSMSDDPFVRENATPTPWDDGHGIRVDSLTAIRVGPCMGVRQGPLIKIGLLSEQSTWKTLGAIVLIVQTTAIWRMEQVMEALTQTIMRVWIPHHPPLLLCSHHMLRQPILHTTMNSRSSSAIPVTRLGTSHGTVQST